MKIFYGWRMVGAACDIQFLLAAFLTQALGLYIAILSDEMGRSKTTLSGAEALQSVESAIIGPVLGWVMDRFGMQKMICWGMVLFIANLMLLSQINSVATIYASAILMAIGASLGGYFPLSVALVQWFEKFRALSIMRLGMAAGVLAAFGAFHGIAPGAARPLHAGHQTGAASLGLKPLPHAMPSNACEHTARYGRAAHNPAQ